MTKKFLFLILALVMVVSPNLGKADYNNTVTYLQGQNQNAWITQALIAANIDNLDISYVDNSSSDLMTAIKNVLVLSATGHTNSDDYGQSIATIENNFTNGQLGSLDLLNDDFWGLLALSSIDNTKYSEDIKNFILSQQNPDGGWSWSTTGKSDSNDTAAAVLALLEVDLSASDTVVSNALAYLQTTQNIDGGFGYDLDSDSDGASTAWIMAVLNKTNIDINSWSMDDNNPNTFLQNLEQSDGSFLWMTSDTQGSAMVTAYALLALSGKTYPVNYVELSPAQPEIEGLNLRIEGLDNTICQASNLFANTVLELLAKGAEACGFTYIALDSSYGVYVSAIAGIEAAGMEGWQYWVDWQPAMIGVADYQLIGDEDVLWAFGGFPLYPTRLEVSDSHISVNDSLLIDLKYYDGSNWQVWSQANIHIGDSLYQSNELGQFMIAFDNDGVYPIWAEASNGYVRSNKNYVTVGDGISQTVDLSVNIEDDNGNPSQGDTVSFSVSQSNINFGNLKPGQSAETIVNVSNTGDVPVYIEASVIGNDIFVNNTNLNQSAWDNFNLNLVQFDSSSVNVGLAIPADWSSVGSQTGQLIFWGAGQ